MSGISGAVNSENLCESGLSDRLNASFLDTGYEIIDSWEVDDAVFAHANSGLGNREPQPIFNHDRSKCIVMAGEIYDYDSLQQELEQQSFVFQFPQNDAEFCLKLFEAEGPSCFHKLNGSFAVAIYDFAHRDLFLVTDRFGSWPLYYSLTPEKSLHFGTQVSSVLAGTAVSREIDETAVMELLTLRRVLKTKTLHKAVSLLPPGSFLHYRNREISISKYWKYRYSPEYRSESEWAKELAAVLKKTVNQTTRGTKRIGVLLSGGLDARAIIAASDKDMICYTMGDYKNPEYETARKIAEQKGYRIVFLHREPDHYFKMVDQAVEIGNGMYEYNHAHVIGFTDTIREECDVLLHGFAPELYLRGTSLPHQDQYFLGMKVAELIDYGALKDDISTKILEKMKYSIFSKRPKGVFVQSLENALEEVLKVSVQELLDEASKYTSNVCDKYLWTCTYYHARFPSFLFELSLRPYFTERSFVFHNEFMDIYLRMPSESRTNNRIWIKALSELNSNIARIPDANTGFSPFLPMFMVSLANLPWSLLKLMDKTFSKLPGGWRLRKLLEKTFPVHFHPQTSPTSWPRYSVILRQSSDLQQLIRKTINDPECINPALFNVDRLNAVLTETLECKDDHHAFLFTLLTFGRWHKKYGPRTAN